MSNTINDKVTVSEIAHAIAKDWAKPSPYALDYLNAMKSISSVNDDYFADSAKSVILYFLANASTYRGDSARAYKALLREMIK